MSGSLPGWLCMLALVLLYLFSGYGLPGYNSASGFRLWYDSLYNNLFPFVTKFRKGYAGSVLRFHYGPKCKCKNTYGFYEYFLYPFGHDVGHVGRGGISIEKFMNFPGMNPDLIIVDFPVLLGNAFNQKLMTFTDNFVWRVMAPLSHEVPGLRTVNVRNAWFLVSNKFTDEHLRLLYDELVFCGEDVGFVESPTDRLVKSFDRVNDGLVQYLNDKSSLLRCGYLSSLENIRSFYERGLFACHNRTVDMVYLLTDMIDWLTAKEKGFDKQILFDILLVRSFIDAGDKTYYRERQLARLLDRVLVSHNKRRRKKLILILEQHYYFRDNIGHRHVIQVDDVPIDQDFHDFNHAACQDYDEIRARV